MEQADLAAVLNGFSEVAFLLDERRRILAFNDAAGAAFAAARVGRDFVTVMREPEALRLVDRVLDGGDRAQEAVTLDSALKGLFRMTVSHVDGLGVVVSFSDLSHVRAAERMRSDFVANVSHELRSPLTALSGFIETLRGPARDDEAARARFLDLMEREAARMSRLISDLLSLSRVEANAAIRPAARVDLAALARSAVATLAPVAERERVTVETSGLDRRAPVIGDEDQLTQVIHNLLENAIKYAGPGKTARVSIAGPGRIAGVAGPAFAIEVRDNGPGMAAEHIPRLTERFYRVDAGRSRDKGGTGLGLAIVKHIVARHRGRLFIESAPGEGARFRVALPAAA